VRLNSAKITLREYLRPKNASTARIYLSHINKYFQLFNPELIQLWEKVRRNKPEKERYFEKLDQISLQYISSERNFRNDLLDYKDHIEKYGLNETTVNSLNGTNYGGR
jgi:hypothetical protein